MVKKKEGERGRRKERNKIRRDDGLTKKVLFEMIKKEALCLWDRYCCCGCERLFFLKDYMASGLLCLDVCVTDTKSLNPLADMRMFNVGITK